MICIEYGDSPFVLITICEVKFKILISILNTRVHYNMFTLVYMINLYGKFTCSIYYKLEVYVI